MYCSLTKVRVQQTDVFTKLKVEEEIIEPSKIRNEMKNVYQNKFNKQDVKEGTEAIDNFLKPDDDLLLETVLCSMRECTLSYKKNYILKKT